MQTLPVRVEINIRTQIYRYALWILVLSAGVCRALPQQHEQAAPQESLTIQDSLSVRVIKFDDVPIKAGEDFNFSFLLDEVPTFSGGGVMYVISPPDGRPGIQTSATVIPGERECKGSYRIPDAAPGGTWILNAIGLSDGFTIRPFKSAPRTFQVIAKQGLVFPTSADIVVNPSQQQLLRLEARHLQHRIEDLKAAIVAYQQANQQGRITQVLRTNVEEAVKALDLTESEFESRATAKDQSNLAKTFFSDLRLNYDTVVLDLDRHSAGWSEHGQLLKVGLPAKAKSDNRYPILAQAALRAFEGNELAYNIVAETGLTFDLKVTSNPSGAVVSYHRRGDPPHQCPDPTTTVIPSLPLAIWYVRVEMPGYKAQEREHDAIRSTDHVVNVELSPQRSEGESR
jgi:hypothetical protein